MATTTVVRWMRESTAPMVNASQKTISIRADISQPCQVLHPAFVMLGRFPFQTVRTHHPEISACGIPVHALQIHLGEFAVLVRHRAGEIQCYHQFGFRHFRENGIGRIIASGPKARCPGAFVPAQPQVISHPHHGGEGYGEVEIGVLKL